MRSLTEYPSRPYPGVSFDATRPALAVPCLRRLHAAGQPGQLRRAVNGANAPASNAPENGRSKVVPGGPRNPHSGASRTLRQPCPAGLSRPTRSLRSHAGTSPAPVGRRGFETLGVCDTGGRLPSVARPLTEDKRALTDDCAANESTKAVQGTQPRTILSCDTGALKCGKRA